VSSIIVNSTNFPSSGTTNDVGGIISASSRKKTVNERRIEILKLTYDQITILLWALYKSMYYNSSLFRCCPMEGKTQVLWETICPYREWSSLPCKITFFFAWWCWMWCLSMVLRSMYNIFHFYNINRSFP